MSDERSPASITGSHPAIKAPAVPTVATGSIEAWVLAELSEVKQDAAEAKGEARLAREVAERVEKAIGRSPDKALDIPGSGFLGSLSKQIDAREDEQKRNATLRMLLVGAVSALTVAATVIGILKAFGVIGGH